MEEVELLERVLLRLGIADTDEKLENTVAKFLAPVILKIESPNDNVRAKVIEVLTHLNKRLKSRSAVQIPVEPLLHYFRDSKSAFAHNFAIIYITMGFPRLSIEQQTELAPVLLTCLDGKSDNHQDKLLMLVLPLLGELKFPDDPVKRKTFLGLDNKPKTRSQFIALLQDVLLLPYGVTAEGELPPGLSLRSFKRIIAYNWRAEELELLKKGIVRFCCSGVFNDLETFILLVLASADTRFSAATPAIAELSKICTTLDFSDPKVTAPLYTLFSGNGSQDAELKTTPCSARVRQKLLQYLIRSRGKGINTIKGIQVIFESLYGEQTNQKCKILALQFSENLIKDGPKELINKLGKVILSGLQKLIGRESTEHINVQIRAYSAVGQLSQTCPKIVNQDLKILVTYFNHLTTAPADLDVAIRDALVSMAPAFAWNDNNTIMEVDEDNSQIRQGPKFQLTPQQNLLLAMLTDNAESKLQSIQNVASVFLTSCFPEYFAPARYLLLLIAGDQSALRESVTSFLYGVSKKDNINYNMLSSIDWPEDATNDFNKLHSEQRRVLLPNFKQMINYVHTMCKKRLVSSSSHKAVIGKTTLAFNLNVYQEILDYLRLCLWYSAGIKSQPGDEKNIDKLRKYILENYENNEDNEIYKYLHFVRVSVEAKRDVSNLACLYDLLNAAPSLLAKEQMHLKETLAISLKDVSETIRINVSQIYGLLMAYGLSDDEFNSELNEIMKTLPQKSLEHRHGLILVIGHALSNKISSFSEEKRKAIDFIGWKEFAFGIEIIVKMLFDSQSLLVSSAVKAIMLIGKLIEIPNFDIVIPQERLKSHTDDGDEVMEAENIEINAPTKHIIFEVISFLLKHSSTRARIREDSAKCLGYLAIGDGKYFVKRNLEKFLSIAKLSKDAVLNITISQAICCCLTGDDTIEETKNKKIQFCDEKIFNWFVDEVIKMIGNPNPHSRQSCAVWLLGIVKNCSTHTNLLAKKQILQYAFTELLSDDSEFVQDVASRGLGLVYQISDPNSQNELANSLLDQLIGGKKQVNQLNPESEIFPEGFLGKTPTGGNITTYKELCSLASDLNQPDMIYQFMQLANHNATWTSKLGAAFGLKSISKDAKEKMQPHLGKIIPRLYRYKYDPTPKIQNSMVSIWDSVVADSKASVELYYWEIMKEILTNLTVNEWRVRISCCLAVRDLLKRPNGLRLKSEDKKFAKDSAKTEPMEVDGAVPEPELRELWSQLFRVMDDIHEGTRIAAEGSASTLSKICVIAASSNHGKSGVVVASSILPLLLEVGVTHTVPEIRKISIKTISELIDSSGPLVKPHLPVLIPCLLKATGELEMKKLSYLSTRLGADTEAQEAVDLIRAEAAKSHHTMDTISKCIRHIDYSELESMSPAILELMKTTVNLGTKVACAHFLCLISIRLGKEMQPVVGKYLGACFLQLKDRNGTVRKYFASAIGHLIGLAKEQSVKNLFQKLEDFYTEDPSNKGITLVVQSINKRQHDLLKDYWENVLPLIFFAMHEEPNDENKENVELWKELWIEIAPGNAGITMNLRPIISKLKKFLDDDSWTKKTQSANAINNIATSLGQELDYSNRLDLIQILLSSLQGRTFDGKERLLDALGSLCIKFPKDDEHVDNIVEAALREARKEEPLYRTKALKNLALILEEFEADRFEEVYQMIWHILDKKSLNEEENGVQTMIDERNKKANVLNQLKETVFETLGKSWPKNSYDTQQKYQVQLAERCAQCLPDNVRSVQVSLLTALEKYLDRLMILNDVTSISVEKKAKIDPERDTVIHKILTEVLNALSYASALPHTGLKKASLIIYMTLIKKLKGQTNAQHLAMVRDSFQRNLDFYEKDHAPEVKCRLRDVEETLKKTLV